MLAMALIAASPVAARRPPLRDPVLLNIGYVCRWDTACMARQQQAMEDALGYVQRAHPPLKRLHLCNRNASRPYTRVDWVGFDNCIRNRHLKSPKR